MLADVRECAFLSAGWLTQPAAAQDVVHSVEHSEDVAETGARPHVHRVHRAQHPRCSQTGGGRLALACTALMSSSRRVSRCGLVRRICTGLRLPHVGSVGCGHVIRAGAEDELGEVRIFISMCGEVDEILLQLVLVLQGLMKATYVLLSITASHNEKNF